MKRRAKRLPVLEIALVLILFFMLSLLVNFNRSEVKSEVADAYRRAVIREENIANASYAEAGE